ncbi:MAG: GAF domain-containing protein [Chitinophagaceae bacterium]|nr:MAG: GAF domain-containing protein [Chitinophagaceae bacterium]
MTYISHFVNKDLSEGLTLPFKLYFNFKKLIEWWQNQLSDPNPVVAEKAMLVVSKVAAKPELAGPISESADLDRFQTEIEMLLEPFFPPILTNFDFRSAGIPFKPMFFNHTARFAKLLEAAHGDVRVPMRDTDMMYVFACMTILNGYYGAGITFLHDLHFDFHDKKTGVLHRFLSKVNSQFCEITPNGTAIALSKDEIRELMANFTNVEVWKQKIPPDSFRLEGFTIVTLFDVTRTESISALKYDLLNKDAFTDPSIVARIEQNICALLNTPDLRAAFLLYDKTRDLVKPIGRMSSGNISLSPGFKNKPVQIYGPIAFNRIFQEKQPYIISDVSIPQPADELLMEQLRKKKLRSYLAMPLIFGDSLVGILELASESPDKISAMSVFTLQEILLLLTNVMNRLQHEQQNEVEAIIRKYCTAIHPTVAWRFNEAAESLIEVHRGEAGIEAGMEDIVFEEVHPLYGQADIQDSSMFRNKSIQQDLISQLTLAKNILDLAS